MAHSCRWIPVLVIALGGCGGSDAQTGLTSGSGGTSGTAGVVSGTTRDAAAGTSGMAGVVSDSTRDGAAGATGTSRDARDAAIDSADAAYVSGDASSAGDSAEAGEAGDAGNTGGTGMIPCSALKPLADLPIIGPWRTHYAFYAPDRSWLLLQVRGTNDSLIRVDLPSGKATTIVDRLNVTSQLGKAGPFLLRATGSNGDDTSVYDGKQVRKILTGPCNIQPTPDGTRLYAVCSGDDKGLQSIDLATGKVSIVDKSATMATTWGMAVSPNSQWVAYRTGDSFAGARTMKLVSVAGASETITSAQGVDAMEFASDDLLVFHTTYTAGADGDLRGHTPGSGDTSFLIVADDYQYQFSLDRTRAVVAKYQRPVGSNALASLYSIPAHGGDPQLLVKDWSIPDSDMTYAFDFDSQGTYALYVSLTGYDLTGSLHLPTYTVSVVDMKGSQPRKLSNDWRFGLTRSTSSVLLWDTDDDGKNRLRLTDLATGADRLSATSSAQILGAMALRGDQAVLFVDNPGGTRRARFMSANLPQSAVLGVWNETDYRGATPMPVYADPTECFTIVNTELAPGPGTRLVLLPE